MPVEDVGVDAQFLDDLHHPGAFVAVADKPVGRDLDDVGAHAVALLLGKIALGLANLLDVLLHGALDFDEGTPAPLELRDSEQ